MELCNSQFANPRVWGRSMWRYMYSTALRNDVPFKITLITIVDAIPCAPCRKHAQVYIRNHEPPNRAGKNAFLYVYTFECSVRKRLGQSLYAISDALDDHVQGDLVDRGRKLLAHLKRALPKPCTAHGLNKLSRLQSTHAFARYERLVEFIADQR